MSLEVKIPAMRVVPELLSITQTAVVLFSFMSFAASLTVAFGPTVAGWVLESMMDVRSGNAVFSRSASTYASIAAACGFVFIPGPSSVWTPANAEYNFSEADELRSTLSSASWKTFVMSRRPTTFPSSLQTGCQGDFIENLL